MRVGNLRKSPDRAVPYLAFKVDVEVDANGVTEEYLAAHGDVLSASTQMYPPFTEPDDMLFCSINGADIASMTRPLTDNDVGAEIVVNFPGDVLRGLTSGEYAFTYRCEAPDGTVIGLSAQKMILVDLTPSLTLIPPQVEHGGDGNLNPMLALQGAKVQVRYQGMTAGHRVQVHWDGTPGDGTIDTAFETVPAPQPDFLEFAIAPAVVAANVGAPACDVRYTVSRSGADQTSPAFLLSVLRFMPNNMPVPQLPDLAGNDYIEPDKLPNGARVQLQPWRLAFERQRLWFWAEGEHEDRPGESYVCAMRDGLPITATEAQQGIDVLIPSSWLGVLKHGSRLMIRYQVGFHDEGRQDGFNVSFEVRNR
ncbi:hypothetical protein PCA31118_02871 [Pandoraea captiosa]|uniref:Uncharacterized protein n=1 Tax=Pandoraea captiosa TaxID=2508302 RepID=A0A5E5A528_9BURK|nr:hypothetical protein [Pandoraea captiosa]VVE68336.1 hypothetical protein PCA31118_02871 [Pandoraea captiosa]